MDGVRGPKKKDSKKKQPAKAAPKPGAPQSVEETPKKKRHCCLWSCLTFFLLLLAAGGALWYLVFVGESKPDHEIIFNPAAAKELSAAFPSEESAAPKTSIEITESQLTSLIFQGLQGQFTTFQVAIFENRFELWGKLKNPKMTILADLKVKVDKGKIEVDIVRAKLGLVPVPGSIVARIETLINDYLKDFGGQEGEQNKEPGLNVKSIEQHNGYIVVFFELPAGA